MSVGSFDSLNWQLAETMVVHWSTLETGVEGVNICFDILDRLAEEATNQQKVKFTVHIYLMHAAPPPVLKAWNHLFKRGQINLMPSQILEKIDRYVSESKLFEPNIATYTLVLDGASHCPNPAERIEFTEKLLVRLLEESADNPGVLPTTVTFSIAINAFARSGKDNAAERAEKLLELAQEMHNKGYKGLEPNSVMYTTVIKAWAKAGNPHRGELLLRRMYEDYALNGNTNVKPNIWTFNTVLAAWSKSSQTGAVEDAEKLLRRMIDLSNQGLLDCQPDTVSYNCLLHALARKRKSFPDASAKAQSLVEEMLEAAARGDKAVVPNEITYTALFKILNSSGSKAKSEQAKYWVEKIHDKRILDDPYVTEQLKQLGGGGSSKGNGP
eukprot:scaffold22620_cov131-Cylindrotheca_fusiformis.AAC.19